MSPRELDIWFGLLLGSLQYAEQGNQLWESKYDTLARPDFRPYMALTRVKQIRKYVTATMAKNEARDTEAWWPLQGGVERFNAKRRALPRTVPVRSPRARWPFWGIRYGPSRGCGQALRFPIVWVCPPGHRAYGRTTRD